MNLAPISHDEMYELDEETNEEVPAPIDPLYLKSKMKLKRKPIVTHEELDQARAQLSITVTS